MGRPYNKNFQRKLQKKGKKMMMIKLRKLFAKESLARARKRVKNELKRANLSLIYQNVFKDGTDGYLRDRNCYGK